MTIVVLVFLGGVLTILSPCILPVLPFVFARSEQKFATNGLPMLAGMAITFAGIATLAAVGGSWAVRVNQYGRVFALLLLTAFAATLLSTRLADWLSRPFVALGNRLAQPTADTARLGLVNSLLLGVATGLLWAPCAGPILGLILTGAAISGPNARTTLLLFAYAVLFLPLALVSVRSALLQAQPRLEEAGHSLGLHSFAVLVRITLPLAAPGLGAAAAMVFISVTTELTATLLLAPIGTQTLATQIWADTSTVAFAAAAPFAAAMAVMSMLASWLLARRFGAGSVLSLAHGAV